MSDSHTSDTRLAGKTSNTSTDERQRGREARPEARIGEHVTAVQFGAWGPQEFDVRASSGGGRDGAPYVAVTIGACLVYVYDQGALDSHLTAWQNAAKTNQAVRLSEFTPRTAHEPDSGADLAVVCHVRAEQHHAVVAATWADGRPVIAVTVGAITVRAHTTTAVRSYLAAWTKAATVTALLEDARDTQQ